VGMGVGMIHMEKMKEKEKKKIKKEVRWTASMIA
jgi:hypothetical protein